MTENDALLTDIKICEIKLERLKKKAQTGISEDIKKLHATNHRILSAWSGRDSKKLTVFEYYNDLKDYTEDASEDKQRQTNRS